MYGQLKQKSLNISFVLCNIMRFGLRWVRSRHSVMMMIRRVIWFSQNGQTPLSIAHRLGFISVVEVLRIVTKVNVATPEVDDGYNIVYPETMLEAPMDSDEEGGTYHVNIVMSRVLLRHICFVLDLSCSIHYSNFIYFYFYAYFIYICLYIFIYLYFHI